MSNAEKGALPEPGPELDVLFLEKIEGFPQGKAFLTEYGWYYIPSGKPRRTHMIDAVPVPRYSTDDSIALAALERFCNKRGIWWEMQRAPHRYAVRLIGEGMPIYAQTATTLAHAVVLAMLEASNAP